MTWTVTQMPDGFDAVFEHPVLRFEGRGPTSGAALDNAKVSARSYLRELERVDSVVKSDHAGFVCGIYTSRYLITGRGHTVRESQAAAMKELEWIKEEVRKAL